MSVLPDLATSSDFAATLSSMPAFLKRREPGKERNQAKEHEQGGQAEQSPSLIVTDAPLVSEISHPDNGQGRGQHEESTPFPMLETCQVHSRFEFHPPNGDRRPDPHKSNPPEVSETPHPNDLTKAATVDDGTDILKTTERLTGSVIHEPGSAASQSPSQRGGNNCDVVIAKITRLLTSSDEGAFLLSATQRLQSQAKSNANHCTPLTPQIVCRVTDPETLSISPEQGSLLPTSMCSGFAFLSESKWNRQKFSPLANLGTLTQYIEHISSRNVPSAYSETMPSTSLGTMLSTNCEPTLLTRQTTINSMDKLHYSRPLLMAFSGYEVPPSNIKDIRAAIKEGNDKMASFLHSRIAQATPFVSRSEPLSTRPNTGKLHDPWSSTSKTDDVQHAPTYELPQHRL